MCGVLAQFEAAVSKFYWHSSQAGSSPTLFFAEGRVLGSVSACAIAKLSIFFYCVFFPLSYWGESYVVYLLLDHATVPISKKNLNFSAIYCHCDLSWAHCIAVDRFNEGNDGNIRKFCSLQLVYNPSCGDCDGLPVKALIICELPTLTQVNSVCVNVKGIRND